MKTLGLHCELAFILNAAISLKTLFFSNQTNYNTQNNQNLPNKNTSIRTGLYRQNKGKHKTNWIFNLTIKYAWKFSLNLSLILPHSSNLIQFKLEKNSIRLRVWLYSLSRIQRRIWVRPQKNPILRPDSDSVSTWNPTPNWL